MASNNTLTNKSEEHIKVSDPRLIAQKAFNKNCVAFIKDTNEHIHFVAGRGEFSYYVRPRGYYKCVVRYYRINVLVKARRLIGLAQK